VSENLSTQRAAERGLASFARNSGVSAIRPVACRRQSRRSVLYGLFIHHSGTPGEQRRSSVLVPAGERRALFLPPRCDVCYDYSIPYSSHCASTRSRSSCGGMERAGNLCLRVASTPILEDGTVFRSSESASSEREGSSATPAVSRLTYTSRAG